MTTVTCVFLLAIHFSILCFYWLLYVLTGAARGRWWQTYAQSLSLHQHTETGFDVTFDPWPGVCWVGQRSPLLVESVVWSYRTDRRQWVLQYFDHYCSVRSTGTLLVVHGGYVNLKGSNVGHQEGQSPPVDHLRGVDITGVHFGHAPWLSPWQQQETAQPQVQLTLISMTLSKRICGFSWNSNWKFWKRIAGKHLYYTSLYCTLLYSTVFYCILVYSSLPYLIVEGAVGGFLCRCVFFLISHSDENCWVDVHSNELLSLVDVHIHLHTQQRTGIEQTTNP